MINRDDRSVLTRLLAELSWEGRKIKAYRDGGRGFENVLTAEALQSLDLLPRGDFLGAVLRQAHGTATALRVLAEQVEECEIELLPGNYYLRPNEGSHIKGIAVQPDAVIESPSICCLLEAKRIKRSRFSVQQLAREYFLVTRDCKDKAPLLFLVLGEEPPVYVSGHGRIGIIDAIRLSLADVYAEAEAHPLSLSELDAAIPESYAWITWREIADIVSTQAESFASGSPSTIGSVRRLAKAVTEAVDRHS